MKHISAWISILLLIAGLSSSLMAQPQYYNYNTTGSANSFPFNMSAGKDVQLIFLPGDFNQPSPAPAGSITSISFMLASAIGPATYTTFTIQMGQTTSTSFNGTSFYTGTLTTVYSRASVLLTGTAGTWWTLTLDTPFPYDPTQSLVIDIGQCGASGTVGSGSMAFTSLSGNRRNWSVGGCPFALYGANNAIYNMGINLTVSGPPICVTTAATAITGISANLNGTVNANGASTTVTFDYGLTTAYGTTVPGVPPTVSGSTATAVTAAIAGLTPNTVYHYRVNGVNGSGTTHGNDMSFTTGPPPPSVVTTAATGFGLNTATVNGTVNANNGSTTVTFQYGLTGAYGTTVPGVPSPVGGTTVTNVSAALTGLLGNTTYHYRVVGVSAGGTSNGNDMTFTTAGPPIVVTNPAMNITHTSATLNGAVTGNYLSTTTSFNWGLTASYGNSIAATPTPVTGNTATPVSANLSGLTDLTTYHYQCVGVNAGGITLGADQTFQTGCTPPAAPGSISGPVQVCQGGTGYVYSVAPIPLATSYVWTVPVGASITAGSGTNSITVSFSPTALYGFVTVAGIGSCGNGTASSLTVSVFTAASPTITGPATACKGSTNSVYQTQFGFSNYIWTITGGTITAGQGTYAVTVTWNNSGNQTISVNYANQNGCYAPAPTVNNVTINAIPTPTISGASNLCVNSGSYTYITQSGFSNYIWTVSNGGTIVAGQGTSILLASWNTSGAQNVSVNYSNGNGCTAINPVVFPVTVNPVPGAAGAIAGTATVCAGASGVVYSVGSIQNATAYAWDLPAGATNSTGASTSSITVDFATTAASGNITVSGNNTCGNGAPSPAFAVTVNDIPVTPVVTNTGATLYSSAPTGNQWYFEGTLIQGATAQTYMATQDGYYWSVVTLTGCVSDSSNHKLILTTGINTHSSDAINIYPVPNDGQFNISIITSSVESFNISVYNSLGVNIYEEAKVEVNGSLNKVIDLRPIPKGVYTVTFKDSQQQLVKKIVVSK